MVSRLSKWRGAKLGLILKVPVAFQDLTLQDPAVPPFRASPRPRQVHRTSASAASSADNDSEPIKAWRIRVAFDANK